MINEKIVPISPYGFRFPTETEMAIDETLKLCGISGEDASMIAIEVMKKLGKSNEIPACCRGDRDAHTDNSKLGLPLHDGEVVRCKDCVENDAKYGNEENWCLKFGYTVHDDDFCSYGERLTDG